MLNVEPTGQSGVAVWPPEVAKTATKLSSMLLKKHSPAGCTVDMPPSNCRQRGHIISPRDT